MIFNLFTLIFGLVTFLGCFAFSKSIKTGVYRSGVAGVIFLILAFLWLVFPFSPERWANASFFEKRLLAQNFLKTHDYQNMTIAEITNLFGPATLRDQWQYYVETRDEVLDLNGFNVRFTEGKVSSVETWFSKPIKGSKPYSSTEWKTADKSLRSVMVADLIASKTLIGKNKTEVLQELDQPDHWSEVAYSLGMFPWLFEMDVYGLEFQLDENLRTKSARIVQY